MAQDLRRFADHISLPTLPPVVQRLTELIEQPDSGPAEAGSLINQDPPLAGSVLRIANSSFYGLIQPCVTADQACTVLGLRLVRTIVLQASVIREYEHLRDLGLDLEALWKRCSLVGRVCSFLARKSSSTSMPRPDEAHLIGLLQDVGQLVLLDALGMEYVDFHRLAHSQHVSLQQVERQKLATDHAALGGSVAKAWGLPQTVSAAIQRHHSECESDLDSPAVYLITTSNKLVELAGEGRLEEARQLLPPATEKRLGISAQELQDALKQVRELLRSTGSEAA
jgi:HD-like signal output (HDOD) protein